MFNNYAVNPYAMPIDTTAALGIPPVAPYYTQNFTSNAGIAAYAGTKKDDTAVKVGVLGTIALTIATLIATKGKKGAGKTAKNIEKATEATEKAAKAATKTTTAPAVAPAVTATPAPAVTAAPTATVAPATIPATTVTTAATPVATTVQTTATKAETVAKETTAEAEAYSERVADFYNKPKAKGKIKESHEWQYNAEKLQKEQKQIQQAEAEAYSERVADFYNKPKAKGKVVESHEWQYNAQRLQQEQKQAEKIAQDAKDLEAFKNQKVVAPPTKAKQRAEGKKAAQQTEAPITDAELATYQKSLGETATAEQTEVLKNVTQKAKHNSYVNRQIANVLPQETQDKLLALKKQLSMGK